MGRLEWKETAVRFRFLAVLVPSLLWLVAACSNDSEPEPTVASQSTQAAPAATSEANEPRSFTGSDGVTVVLDEAPQRIVSLATHATEIFCALGVGERLVAVDRYANCSDGGGEKPEVDSFQPSVEAIVAYDPDFVYAWYDPGDLARSLRDVGITVFLLDTPVDLEGLFDNIRLIGEMTDREDGAEALVAELEADRDAVVASIADIETGPRIYHESDAALYTARSDTFVGELYVLLKAQNIADGADSQYPQLSSEAVVASDPEVIILADFADPAEVAARPGWAAISAVLNDQICEINSDLTDRPGPNIMQGLRALRDCLYPD